MEGPAHSAESFRGVSGGEGGGGEAFARMQVNGAVELIDPAWMQVESYEFCSTVIFQLPDQRTVAK